ncbi:MAG TPA: polysaccharide deacetylase family protein [Trebonia sp.]|nr:polysaccharide deacetylase family protein [Trebonia sp.]
MSVTWPDGKQYAVFVNVAFEAWAEGKAPGISPMGNPLPGGLFDTQARTWGEYGVNRGIWNLLRLLGEQSVAATFLTSGIIARLAPDAVRAITEQGHAVCAHGMSQDEFPGTLDEQTERERIESCRDLLAGASGTRPRGFSYPRGTASPRSAALVAGAGFRWFADQFDDDRPYVQQTGNGPLVILPLTMEVNDLPQRMRHGFPADVFETAFDQMTAAVRRFSRGDLYFDVTVHTHVGGRPLGALYFERVLEKIKRLDGEAWVTTRDAAAEHVARAHGLAGPEG